MTHYEIREARAVAYRAFSLGTMLKRVEYEITLQNLNDFVVSDRLRERITIKHQARHAMLRRWLHQENIIDHLTPSECHALEMPLGTWSAQMIIDTSWRVEALGMLLWALGAVESVPPYDTQFEPEDVLPPLDIPQPIIDVLWRAEVRDEAEIIAACEMSGLWFWRSQAKQVRQAGALATSDLSYSEIIELTALQAYHAGDLPQVIDGDFPAFGKAYAKMDEEQYSMIASIAYERHMALNWLCGFSDYWDSVG